MFTSLALSALMSLAGPAASTPTNTLCPVMGNAVTPGKSPIVKVNGREYYICCPGCRSDLEKTPGKYLNKDGTPKNAKAPAAAK